MSDQNFKQPAECETMVDVRHAIDMLDQQLLDLLSKRIEYIRQAARIKTTLDSIRDDQRIEAIISKRKSQAAEYGYSEQLIENLFRELIEYSVAYEMKLWKEINRTR